MKKNLIFTVILLFIGFGFLPVSAFGFDSIVHTKNRVFTTEIIRIGQEANPPKISMSLPQAWTVQNEHDNESFYELQFYPPGQSINSATESIRLQVFKFKVANTKLALNEASDMLKNRMLSENTTTEFLASTDYLQAGLNTVEFLSLAQADGSSRNKVLSLTKLIATDHLANNSYGLIVLNKHSFQIHNTKELEQAMKDIEAYRNEFRKLRLISWMKWDTDSGTEFENKLIDLTGLPSGPKISIDIPKGWLLSEVVENQQGYYINMTPATESKTSLRYDQISLSVSKGPLYGGYTGLENYIYTVTKEQIDKIQAKTIFSPPIRHLQEGLETIEYSSDWTSIDGTRLLTLYKDIDTGAKLGNNLGLVSVKRIISTLDPANVLTLKEELESYRLALRNIKLIDWPNDTGFLKPEFGNRIINIGSNGAQLSLPVPSDWDLEKQDETANGYSFSFMPSVKLGAIAESLKIVVYKTASLYNEQSLRAYLAIHQHGEQKNKPGIEFSTAEEYNVNELNAINYSSVMKGLNDVQIYSNHSLISTGFAANNQLGLVAISKYSSVLNGSDITEIEENLDLFKAQMKKIELLNWANGLKLDEAKFEERIFNIDLQGHVAQIAIPLSADWYLEENIETEKYINLNFKKHKGFFANSESIKISILKSPYLDDYQSLHQFSSSLKNTLAVAYNGTIFSDDIEYRQSAMKTVEFNSDWTSPTGSHLQNYNKIIATGFSSNNYLGLIHINKRTSFHDAYDRKQIALDLELYKNAFRNIRLINWQNNKLRPKLSFRNIIINVLKERGGAKISIPIPDTWTLESRDETDKSIKFSFEPREKDPLIGESILLVVRKDYFKNDLATIKKIVKDLKKQMKETHKRVVFSKMSHYVQGDNQIFDYTGSYFTNDANKVVLLDKLITTGSDLNNNLGLVIVSKVYTSIKDFNLNELEPEMESYRQEFKKIKLVKWDP